MVNGELLDCGSSLKRQMLTVAFGESATAGRVISEFSMIPESGDFLKGGIVCYDAVLKQDLLDVSKDLIDKYTPESEEVTKALTNGLSKLISADIHIGITGLTAPGGSETKDKPVGTMFIYAQKNSQELFSDRIVFKGGPEEIILQTVYRVAVLLKGKISEPG